MRYEYRYSNKAYTRALEATKNNKMYVGGSMSPIEVMKWYEDQVKVIASRDEPSSTDWKFYILDDHYSYPEEFTILEVPVGLSKVEVRMFNEWSRNTHYTIQMKMDWLLNELLVKDNATSYTSENYEDLKLIEDTLTKHDKEIQNRYKELCEPYLVKLAQHREYHKCLLEEEELVVKKLKQQKLEKTLAETRSEIFTGIFLVVLIAAITILGIKG